MDIHVENIKCGGCAGTITKKLRAKFNAENINIDIENGIVSIDTDAPKAQIAKVLLDLGYPQVDSVQGFDNAKAKAKSFVSCAIGKLDT